MPTEANGAIRSWVPLFIAVCLVAINMRMSITGVGPMLDSIAKDEGTSPAALGLLAAIPLLAWALVSPLAQSLAGRIGLDSAVSYSLVGLFVATIWRSIPGTPVNLWLGTALIGVSLAVANVLLPASIKRDFGNRVPLVMGVYSALIGASGALGASIVAPVANLALASGDPLGWRWALLVTGATIPIALAAWMVVSRQSTTRRKLDSKLAAASDPSAVRRVWRDPVAWWIALYMGSQSWVFYIHAMWLAPISISRDSGLVEAGGQVTFFHIFGIMGSLLSPFLMRGVMHKLLPILIPIVGLIGSIGIVLTPQQLPVWLALAGLSCGASLSVAMTYIAQRSASTEIAGAVSGMSQSVGYLLASIGPIFFGLLYGLTGAWVLPLIVLLVGGGLQLAAALALFRERMALSRG